MIHEYYSKYMKQLLWVCDLSRFIGLRLVIFIFDFITQL